VRVNRATIGTIIVVGVVSIVFFSLLASLISNIINIGDMVVGSQPKEPVLSAMYTPLYKMFVYMKSVLTNNITIAVLLAVSILLMALEMRWVEE